VTATILFMGGEMPSFLPSDSGSIETSSGSFSSYDSAFCRCCVRTESGATDWVESEAWTGVTALYCHAEFQRATIGSGYNTPIITFRSGTTDYVRLKMYTSGVLALEYLNASSVWTEAARDTFLNNRQTIDLYVNVSTGILRLYVAGTLRLEATGLSLGHIASLDRLRLNSNYYMLWSQVVVATVPTIGGRLFTVPLSGAGSTSSWTGDYSMIDEIPYSDADFVSSASVNQVSTFAVAAPSLTGYVIQAVGIYARARCGVGGPQNLQLAVRSAGTNYFSASKALSIGYTPRGNIWETNPATSAAWATTAISSLEPGVKSIT
jgi:hypothetical protein